MKQVGSGAADPGEYCTRGTQDGGSYHRVHARLQVRPLKARPGEFRTSQCDSLGYGLGSAPARHARITLLAHDTTSFPSFRYTLCPGARPFNCASLFIAAVKTCLAVEGNGGDTQAVECLPASLTDGSFVAVDFEAVA